MGCFCSKGTGTSEGHGERSSKSKGTTKSVKRNVSSSNRDRHDAAIEVDANGNEATTRLISNHPTNCHVGSTPVSSDDGGRKENSGNLQRVSRIVCLSNGERGAQVVAGWPSWLTAVAGEAIHGWAPRRADSFEKLDKIGQGTYSSVYKARDLETNKIVALKKVRFANMDPESVRFMAREIIILRRLDHPNVMKLEGIITSRVSGSLYLIFEYMEHDLAGLLAQSGARFTEAQIKCYMQQLMYGLVHCHKHGVLHRDIKGSNLLVDHNGNLKIGDFGLATFFSSPQRQPLTSRVVTLWYRPPELLLGATDYGAAVDLWSSGCILAELFAGKPIMPGRTEVEQLHKIFKLCGSPSEEYWKRSKLPHATIFKPQHPYKRCFAETFKDFPSSALTLLDVLLSTEPESRGTASSALVSEFFTKAPLPCAPSSLPKCRPSKEFDVKLRNEDNRGRKVGAIKGRGVESTRKSSKEFKAVAAPDANAELLTSIQKRQANSNNPKSISEKYNPEQDGGSCFPIELSKGIEKNSQSHLGPSIYPSSYDSTQNMNVSLQEQASQLCRFSNSVAVRSESQFQGGRGAVGSQWPEEHFNTSYNSTDESSHQLLNRPKFLRKEEQKHTSDLESTRSYFLKKSHIHYSGPLMPPGGDVEELLKEHERQIQQAVRKARLDKTKTNKTYSELGQAESPLLYNGRKEW